MCWSVAGGRPRERAVLVCVLLCSVLIYTVKRVLSRRDSANNFAWFGRLGETESVFRHSMIDNDTDMCLRVILISLLWYTV